MRISKRVRRTLLTAAIVAAVFALSKVVSLSTVFGYLLVALFFGTACAVVLAGIGAIFLLPLTLYATWRMSQLTETHPGDALMIAGALIGRDDYFVEGARLAALQAAHATE